MRLVPAAAVDGSKRFDLSPRAAALALAAVACISSFSGCKVSVPSGVFSCAGGKACPPGQTCGDDEICRAGSRTPRDGGDAGADTQGEAGPEPDAGARDASLQDSGDDAALEAGAGGKGGSPAAGSGGAGSGGAGGQTAPAGFHVVSTQPAKDGVLEDLGAAIRVTFSAALNAASVTPGSVKLVRDGAEVDGALNTTLTEVTFEPDDPWTLAAHYELQLTNAVRDSKDRPLEPQLVVDAAGNGIAAWTQDGENASLNEVWVARYLRDGGWQAASRVRVSDIEAGTGSMVSLTADDYGRAFVVWTQANQVWSARFE